MGLFGFDAQFAMFDATPVANQFILEYMPTARGDYVKVYLYGLMQCYHPSSDMTLSAFPRLAARRNLNRLYLRMNLARRQVR